MGMKYHALAIIDNNELRKMKQRRKIRRQRIKTICGIILVLSLFYILGVVGGLERDTLTMGQFWVHSTIATSLAFTSGSIYNRL